MIMFGAIATTLVYAPTGLMAMMLEMMIMFKRMMIFKFAVADGR